MKRARGNGGSRTRLKSEGIIILGHYDKHRRIAQSLGAAVPQSGELVAVRIAPSKTTGRGVVRLEGALWRLATATDPIVAAPDCPHV